MATRLGSPSTATRVDTARCYPQYHRPSTSPQGSWLETGTVPLPQLHQKQTTKQDNITCLRGHHSPGIPVNHTHKTSTQEAKHWPTGSPTPGSVPSACRGHPRQGLFPLPKLCQLLLGMDQVTLRLPAVLMLRVSFPGHKELSSSTHQPRGKDRLHFILLRLVLQQHRRLPLGVASNGLQLAGVEDIVHLPRPW